MRRAFFLTSGKPVPIAGARRIRDAQIITLLAKRLPVEVLCVSDQNETASVEAAFASAFGPNTAVSCHPLDRRNPLTSVLDLVRPHFAQGHSRSIEATLKSKANPGDLVWLSRLRMGKYIDLARRLGCFTVLDEHQIESDLLFDNAFTRLRYWHYGLTAAQCALYEKKLSDATDLVVTASPIDASRMGKLAPRSKVHVLPIGIDTATYPLLSTPFRDGFKNGLRLSFIADLDYRPNLHALEWIRDEFVPRIASAARGEKPVIQIHSQIQNQIRRQEKNRIRLSEDFPEFKFQHYSHTNELNEQIRSSVAAIFPLRYGRGNRIAILEAIASGVPVVTTGRGADGLNLKPLADVCIAEDPDEFVSLVMRIARETDFRARILSQGRKTVVEKYDWAQSSSAMDSIFTNLGISETPQINRPF